MSTTGKLNPMVREARRERREMIRSLERVVRHLAGIPAFSASLVLSALYDIHHNASMSGRLKARLFVRIIKQLEAT